MSSLVYFPIAVLLSIVTLIQPVHSASESGQIDIGTLEPKVDALVKKYTDLDIFSGVVLIAENGKPLYHKAFGLADRRENVSNTTDTRFDIGSMNKAFTKVVVLQLANQGKLKLEDPIGKYLEGFPKESSEKITINQLLNHTSGYGTYHEPSYWDLPKEQKSMQTLLSFIKQQPLDFEPGTSQQYSNSGYVILGAIIEKATGKNYFDAVDEAIVKPLGLENTFLREKYNIPGRAIGYMKTMRGEIEDNEFLQEKPTPAGGFYSTTADMLKFFRAYHYGEQLWDEATRRLDDFYPFYQENLTTGGAMSHAGGFEGANTVHFEILRDHISVLVFANMDEPVAEKLGDGILAIIRGQEPKYPSLPAVQSVFNAYEQHGIEYVRKNYEKLTRNFHPEDPKDIILNQIGYNLLFSDDETEHKKSIEIFKLNTELFPLVPNVWDSYGEGLLKNGNKKSALEAYRHALKLDPRLPSAIDAVKKLQ